MLKPISEVRVSSLSASVTFKLAPVGAARWEALQGALTLT
jgi:hypothetical protein